MIIRPSHHKSCHISHYFCQTEPLSKQVKKWLLQSVIHIAPDHMLSLSLTHTHRNSHKAASNKPTNPLPVPWGWQWKVNWTTARVKQCDGAEYCCGHRIKHRVHFLLNTDIDFVLPYSQFIPSPHSWHGDLQHDSDTNVAQDLCHLSNYVWSNYLSHQKLTFIFIKRIIVVKRLLDDNKNAIIVRFVSSIVALVTIHQSMEMCNIKAHLVLVPFIISSLIILAFNQHQHRTFPPKVGNILSLSSQDRCRDLHSQRHFGLLSVSTRAANAPSYASVFYPVLIWISSE